MAPEGLPITAINGIHTKEVPPAEQTTIELTNDVKFSPFGLWADANKEEWAKNNSQVPENSIFGQYYNSASYAG